MRYGILGLAVVIFVSGCSTTKVVETPKITTNEEFKFESKSEPGSFYVVRVIGDKVKCNCAGQYRAKDRQCKHMKEVQQKLGIVK